MPRHELDAVIENMSSNLDIIHGSIHHKWCTLHGGRMHCGLKLTQSHGDGRCRGQATGYERAYQTT